MGFTTPYLVLTTCSHEPSLSSLHCLQHANTEGETGLQEGQKLSIENLWEATAQVGEQLLINSKGGKILQRKGKWPTFLPK